MIISNESFVIILFVLVGLFMIFWGRYKFNEWRKLKKSGVKTEGVVIRVESFVGVNNSSFYPVVRYSTLQDELITEKYDIGGNYFSYTEGDKVDIIYDATNHKEFIIDDTRTMLTGVGVLAAGCLLLVLAVIQCLFHPIHVK